MSLPYFPMFPSDFDADTGHLSLAEDGAYNRLLRLSWKCPGAKMPDDMEWIYRRARAVSDQDKSLIMSVIGEFFTRSGGKIFSKRLVAEWAKSSLAHSKRVSAGSAGGKAKATNAKEKEASNAVAMPYQPEPEPEPKEEEKIIALSRSKPKPERFEEFWGAYPHRGGVKRGRKPALDKYTRLVASGISEQTLIDGAANSASDKQVINGYARDPATWLNQEGWTDEVATAQSHDPERAARLARISKLAGKS